MKCVDIDAGMLTEAAFALPMTAETPELLAVEVSGPPEAYEGTPAQFQAVAIFDLGDVDMTRAAEWSVEPAGVATIEDGLLTVTDIDHSTTITVTASYTFDDVTEAASIDVLALNCANDCNEDGALNVLDWICFQPEWQAMSPAGDCNGDGTYDVLDFVCFQQLFQSGCQ